MCFLRTRGNESSQGLSLAKWLPVREPGGSANLDPVVVPLDDVTRQYLKHAATTEPQPNDGICDMGA